MLLMMALTSFALTGQTTYTSGPLVGKDGQPATLNPNIIMNGLEESRYANMPGVAALSPVTSVMAAGDNVVELEPDFLFDENRFTQPSIPVTRNEPVFGILLKVTATQYQGICQGTIKIEGAAVIAGESQIIEFIPVGDKTHFTKSVDAAFAGYLTDGTPQTITATGDSENTVELILLPVIRPVETQDKYVLTHFNIGHTYAYYPAGEPSVGAHLVLAQKVRVTMTGFPVGAAYTLQWITPADPSSLVKYLIYLFGGHAALDRFLGSQPITAVIAPPPNGWDVMTIAEEAVRHSDPTVAQMIANFFGVGDQ